MDNLELRMALNSEIAAQALTDDLKNRNAPMQLEKKKQTIANTTQTEWNIGSSVADSGGSGGGSFREHWPEHLPQPPSQRKLNAEELSAAESSKNPNMPKVIVFNANTHEGSSMVRVLSEKGLHVVAIVRIVTSRNTKNLMKLRNVEIKVADLNNKDTVMMAAKGCSQAFLLTKYWERFENPIEEQMAQVVLAASATVGIKRLVLATFEDTHELRTRGRKSQLMPTPEGKIYPNFEPMNSINTAAKKLGVQVSHMFTSFLDESDSKKSLILIRGENGKILSQPYIQNTPGTKQ
jgi:hypothetical protein